MSGKTQPIVVVGGGVMGFCSAVRLLEVRSHDDDQTYGSALLLACLSVSVITRGLVQAAPMATDDSVHAPGILCARAHTHKHTHTQTHTHTHTCTQQAGHTDVTIVASKLSGIASKTSPAVFRPDWLGDTPADRVVKWGAFSDSRSDAAAAPCLLRLLRHVSRGN